MTTTDKCPPLYVPKRSECNEALEEAKRQLLSVGLTHGRWNLDGMRCGHGSHIEDVEPA